MNKDLWMGEVSVTRSGMVDTFTAILDAHPHPVDEGVAASLLLMWTIHRPEPSFLVRPSEVSVRMRDGISSAAYRGQDGVWSYKSYISNEKVEIPVWEDDAKVYIINTDE